MAVAATMPAIAEVTYGRHIGGRGKPRKPINLSPDARKHPTPDTPRRPSLSPPDCHRPRFPLPSPLRVRQKSVKSIPEKTTTRRLVRPAPRANLLRCGAYTGSARSGYETFQAHPEEREKNSDLILRSPRSGRLEGWPRARPCLWPSFETRPSKSDVADFDT